MLLKFPILNVPFDSSWIHPILDFSVYTVENIIAPLTASRVSRGSIFLHFSAFPKGCSDVTDFCFFLDMLVEQCCDNVVTWPQCSSAN